MKDNNIKFSIVFKDKGTPKGHTTKQLNPKDNKKPPQKQHNDDKYALKKVPPKQGKKETKICTTRLTNGVSGIRHG